MEIERIEPTDLDLEVAEEIAAVIASAEAGLGAPPPTGPGWMLASQHMSESPTEAVWVARVDGRVVGWSNLVLPTFENTDVARVGGAVHPRHQRSGIGRALFDEAVAATDRAHLRLRTWRGSSGEAALAAHGARRTVTHVVRRLDLSGERRPWHDLRVDADARASHYDLVRRVGPTPEADLAEMSVLREAINDAPDIGEFHAYPPARIAAGERDLQARRHTPFVVVARHRATGEPAGITNVFVDEFAPQVAHQGDTAVMPAHRGHRLGLLLKLEMIDWLRSERPEVSATDTWNAHDNHHMIAVNERLGLRVVAHNTAWKVTR